VRYPGYPAGLSRVSAWRSALRLPAAPTVQSDQVLQQAANGIKVTPRPTTRLVDISCDSTNPLLAADFANALTSEFIEQNLESRWQSAQHTGEWLAHQMEDVRVKLQKSEDALQAYAASKKLLFTQEKDDLSEAKLKSLQEQLSQAQAERVSRQSRYELASNASADSIGEVLDDGNLKDIKSKLSDYRRQVAELSATYTPTNARVKKVQDEIASLQSDFDSQRANILGRIRNDYESARRRESLLTADHAAMADLVSGQADNVSHYNLLKREVDTNRQIYDMVIVDTPPMTTMADARVVARHADGVILVARAHQTSRNQLKDACQRLTEDGIKLLGVVLNCWDPKYSTHYGYYRYYDKYKHYYGGSGEDAKRS
jgi:uncharacterized protein involved in exopolysaccharide biosynthesis